MDSNRPRVLVIGHSFVRRLRDALPSPDRTGPDMNLEQCYVYFYGIGGLQVADAPAFLARIKPVLQDKRPDIVVLQIGENDICSPTISSLSLASKRIGGTERTLTEGY